MPFHVGQKVVYVGLSRSHPEFVKPERNVVYTVRALYTARDGTHCLRLEEIHNEPVYLRSRGGMFERGYKQSRFRPVQTRKTDISIFTAMLTKRTVSVDA